MSSTVPLLSSSPVRMQMCDLMATPITVDDFDFDLSQESLKTMNEFEVAWSKFTKDNPDMVPEGKREENIKELQKKVLQAEETHKEANEELKKQLEFFEKSRDTIENGFKKDLEAAKAKQKKIQEKSEKELDSVTLAEHLLSQTIPWDAFLKAADKMVERNLQGKEEDKPFWARFMKTEVVIDKTIKPSNRAMALVDDTAGDERDIRLRAYKMDNALLNAQIKMLQKEAEGYEKYLESQDILGKFLNEHKIFVTTMNKPFAAKTERMEIGIQHNP